MRFRVWLLGLIAFLAPTVARAENPSFAPPVERHRLENGMEVILAPDASLGDVTVLVRYAVGSADDPLGKEGLAHVVEHLMFDGSRHVAAGEHVRLLEEAGGSKIDGSYGLDATQFVETIPPGRLPLALWLESDRMGSLRERVDSEAVKREWQAADAEEDETHRGSGANAGFEAVWGEIFPSGHPYHHDSKAIGLGVFGLGDVQRFLHTWYSPANARLVIAGHFEAAPTIALVEKYFATLAAPLPPARRHDLGDRKIPDVRFDVTASSAREMVCFSWKAPPIHAPADLALDLAGTVLGAANGRLQRELVDRGLVYNYNVWEQSMAEGSIFHLNVSFLRGKDPAPIIAAIEQVVADLGTTLTRTEIEAVRRAWKETLLGRLLTSSGRAWALSGKKASEDPFDLAKYDPIDEAAVMSVVRTVLVPTRRVVMVTHYVSGNPWFGVVAHREEHAQ